jgi:hypothetical protein
MASTAIGSAPRRVSMHGAVATGLPIASTPSRAVLRWRSYVSLGVIDSPPPSRYQHRRSPREQT